MYIVFALLAILVVANTQNSADYLALDAIPGIDFVGFGYDARFDEARTALQIPLHSYSFTKGKTYQYPADRTRTYRVPDEIVVRTIALTEAEAYLYRSLEELTTAWSLDIGIDFGRSSNTNTSQQLCTQDNSANTTTCNTLDTTNSSSLFSIGTKFAYAKNNFNSDELYVVENTEKTQLFSVFLDTQPIRHEVKQILTALGSTDFSKSPKTYFNFLERYGTHYVVSAVMGGKVHSSSNIKTKITMSSDSIGANVTVKSVSTQDAMNAATAKFSSTLNANVDFTLQNANQDLQSTSSSSWALLGGDPSLVNLLDARTASDAILTWKSSITMNPVAVGYRLRSMATLFEDQFLRKQMQAAIDIYLNTNVDGIVSVTNPDKA